MKILIYSPLFYPSIGGLQTINLILAHQFLEQGHQVKVVCTTQNSDSKNFPFEVIRYPKPLQLLNLLKWCDVYFQANVSLKGIYPLLIHPKPCVISHHGWYIRPNNWDKKTNRDTRPNNWRGWQDYLKQFVTYFVTNISVSQAVANHISGYSVVIPNSYREDIFYEIPEIHRNQELVFLGRLVSEKGANLLLEALSQLKLTGLTPKLTIIGTGPEESNLIQQAKDLKINDQVTFAGVKLEHELAKLLNAHQVMIVPSLLNEPFGIVALEGIACGCVVVGSEGGGLKDAIGPCGVTFANGNVEQLTKALFSLLTNPEQLITYRKHAKSHLAHHTSKAVAKAYLDVIQGVIK